MRIILDIAKRAADLAARQGVKYSALDAAMDIKAVNEVCPLRLEELLNAEPFDFSHDIAGILQHLNRETKTLDGCFLPRFAK
jgi:hypothetical protein